MPRATSAFYFVKLCNTGQCKTVNNYNLSELTLSQKHSEKWQRGRDIDIEMVGMCYSTDQNVTQKCRVMTEKVDPKI